MLLQFGCDNSIKSSNHIQVSITDLVGTWRYTTQTIINDTLYEYYESRIISDTSYQRNTDWYYFYSGNLIKVGVGLNFPQGYFLSNDTIFLYPPEVLNLGSNKDILTFTVVKAIDSSSITLQDENSSIPVKYTRKIL